jgi:hypothetical protein
VNPNTIDVNRRYGGSLRSRQRHGCRVVIDTARAVNRDNQNIHPRCQRYPGRVGTVGRAARSTKRSAGGYARRYGVTDVASGPTLPGAVDDDFQLPQALRDKPTFTPQSHRDIHKNAWKQCLACERLKEDIKFAFKTKDIADFEMRIQMDINHLHTSLGLNMTSTL